MISRLRNPNWFYTKIIYVIKLCPNCQQEKLIEDWQSQCKSCSNLSPHDKVANSIGRSSSSVMDKIAWHAHVIVPILKGC